MNDWAFVALIAVIMSPVVVVVVLSVHEHKRTNGHSGSSVEDR